MSKRLRLSASRGLQVSTGAPVDRENRIIRGASAMQLIPDDAGGHGVSIDEKTLSQVVTLGAANDSGIKVRFAHPGACSDALGTMLGRAKNFRTVGDKAVCDIHFSTSASKTPNGDLADYVMTLAEEDPKAFGMSVAVMAGAVWKLSDGSEIDSDKSARPEKAVGKFPFLRINKLQAVDVVDEPAANRDGLFSAHSTDLDAADAYDAIDEMRDRFAFDGAKCAVFLTSYFESRNLALAVSEKPAGVNSPALTPKGTSMNPESLKALKAKHPDHAGLIVDMFADGKAEAEILAAIKDVELVGAQKRVTDLAAELEAANKALAEKNDKLVAAEKARDAALALGKNAAKDPGADPEIVAPPSENEKIDREWAAFSSEQKKTYFNNVEAYRCAKSLEARDLASAGKEI